MTNGCTEIEEGTAAPAVGHRLDRGVMRPVAVLFARDDSVYKTLPGVDVWDAERDARKWPGGSPLVAHPPCRLWASLRTKSKAPPAEKELAHLAIAHVREFGGVLEHPWLSTLWDYYGLRPKRATHTWTGGERDGYGGRIFPVDLFSFGFPAKKRTGLYIVGVDQLPPTPLRLGHATHTIGLWSGRDKTTCRPSIPKTMFDQTPREMAEWLVAVARKAHNVPLRGCPADGNEQT